MKKRIIAFAASISMALMQLSSFAASGFSDLNEFHAWAEPQIEEMTTLGIIKGYTDGTFRPDQAITKTEALVLAARAAGYISYADNTYTSAAATRYLSLTSTYQAVYPNETAYLLYKGILSENDISSYLSPERASAPLLRYEMADLLTKLMRAESNLKDPTQISLSYSDAGEIPYEYFPAVSYVTDNSLMNGVYDPEYPNDIFFKPYSPVTRAQMAVLLYRVLGKNTVKISYAEVVGKNADSSSITYRTAEKTSILQISESMNLLVDGYATSTVAPIYSGAKIAFFYINGVLCDVEVVNDLSHKYTGEGFEIELEPQTEPVSGTLNAITLGDSCIITVDGVEYIVSASATVLINSVTSTVYDLRVGQSVDVTFTNGKASSITVGEDNSVLTCEGTVTKINTSDKYIYLLIISPSTGLESERKVNIGSGAVITNAISGASLSLSDIDVDDIITASGTVRDGSFYASKLVIR